MVIIETPTFTKQVISTLSDDEYRLFQAALLSRPDAGSVIQGSGGLRKIRWGLEGRGKSGGIRIIYYWITAMRDNSPALYVSKECEGHINANATC